MKQYISIPALLVTLIVTLPACKKDFLNSTVRNTLVREEYIQDLQGCKEYLNGLYILLSASYSGSTGIYQELTADNIKPVTGQNASAFYNWAQTADENTAGNQNMNAFSYSCYQIINSCNFLLGKTTAFRSQDTQLADNIRGQALALRALSYFHLSSVFAQPFNFTSQGVHPGVVCTEATDWTTTFHQRNTVQQVYNMMVSDLDAAVSLLPAQSSGTVTFSRQAAMALLARINLYRQDYAKAAMLATQVAAAVPLTTKIKGYPNDLFKFLPPQQTEVLLQLLPGTSVAMGHSGGGIFPGRYFRSTRQYVATADAAAQLSAYPADARKNWVTFTAGNWNITKFPTGQIADVLPADDAYLLPLLRSSEMFLTAAEAYAQLGREDSARSFLNAIRKRAGIDTVPTSVTAQRLIDSIYAERRRELAFEGFRMYDLLRWKKPVDRKDAASPTASFLPYPSNKAIAPIPARDVLLSGLEQNPGY